MLCEVLILSSLKANEVSLVACLLDSAISSLIERAKADDFFTVVEVTREEQAVGVVSGAWLGHQRGAVLCQSSGLATAINALGSLNKPARIPFVGLISRRGDLGEFNLAQGPFGYSVPKILDAMGIRNHSVIAPEETERLVDMATKTAFSTEEPFILLLETSLFGVKEEY